MLDQTVDGIDRSRLELDKDLSRTGLRNLILAEYKLSTDFWKPKNCLRGHFGRVTYGGGQVQNGPCLGPRDVYIPSLTSLL